MNLQSAQYRQEQCPLPGLNIRAYQNHLKTNLFHQRFKAIIRHDHVFTWTIFRGFTRPNFFPVCMMWSTVRQLNILLEQLKILTWFACNLSTHQRCSLPMALLAQVSPNHISKRLASNNRLITAAGIEPLSPLPSRSLTFGNSFPTRRTIKNMPINKLLICTKIYSILLDTVRLPCSPIDYAQC